MSKPKLNTVAEAPRAAEARIPGSAKGTPRRLLFFAMAVGVLCLFFAKHLIEFVRFGVEEDRSTYLLLIPFISGYLIWIKAAELPRTFGTSAAGGVFSAMAGAAALAGSFGAAEDVARSLQMLSFLLFLLSLGFFFLGKELLKRIQFAICFLIFSVPLPKFLMGAVDVFLQHTSAEAAYWMLSVSPVPFLREGLLFQLPNVPPILVAEECSGFNSTFVLFIVSVLGGHLFLRSTTNRILLSLFVIPLAILRNGLRITTIALLCAYIDPSMIDSAIHRRGGPLFFALSMVPFLGLLWALRRRERRVKPVLNP